MAGWLLPVAPELAGSPRSCHLRSRDDHILFAEYAGWASPLWGEASLEKPITLGSGQSRVTELIEVCF